MSALSATEVLRDLALLCFVLAPLCIAAAELLRDELKRPKSRYDVIMKYSVRDVR